MDAAGAHHRKQEPRAAVAGTQLRTPESRSGNADSIKKDSARQLSRRGQQTCPRVLPRGHADMAEVLEPVRL